MHSTQKRYDAVVAGGGVIGLSVAWRLAREGMTVCVCERDRPGAGASGVAAGMLAPVGEAAWGEDAVTALNLASREAWPAFARELSEASGVEVELSERGALHVALDGDEAAELRRRHGLHRELGLRSEWLRGSECRRLEPGLATPVAGGIHAPGEAAVDPSAVIVGLERAVRAAGGEIRTGCEARELVVTGGRAAGVACDAGEIGAGVVVAACGAWTGRWLPGAAAPPLRPVKGEILTLRTRPREAVCERIVAGERFYAVPRSDGRLIVGATMEEKGFDQAVSAGGVHELLREAYRALPDVAEADFESAAARVRPAAPDNAPVVGEAAAAPGLIVAAGHFRNGVLQAPVTAQAVAAIAAGRERPASVAALGPERFGGERGGGRAGGSNFAEPVASASGDGVEAGRAR